MNHDDEIWMRRALSLARLGRGRVEPNPPVGCVLLRDGVVIGEGYHRQFGLAHAEVDALQDAQRRGNEARGATAYVTLEPCSHFGKTPPCCQALIDAGVARVVAAIGDPSPHVAGQGFAALTAAGIQVQIGVLEEEARHLLGPFLKRLQTGLPWVTAKWAMSLDGKLATHTGHSQWISGPAARQVVHQLRGDMDAIMVGIGTALADDPALTARLPNPPTSSPGDPCCHTSPATASATNSPSGAGSGAASGPTSGAASDPAPGSTGTAPHRRATRVVVDRQLRLPLGSQLVRTADQYPVLLACAPTADMTRRQALVTAGVEVWSPPLPAGEKTSAAPDGAPSSNDFDYAGMVRQLLAALAARGMTHVLVEGGGDLLGNLFDQGLVDEVYVFVSPKILGGVDAISPVGGRGLAQVPSIKSLHRLSHQVLGDDILIHGFVTR